MSRRGRTKRGHNEGSIYQREDGRWVASITFRDAAGRVKRVSRYAKTRTAAREKLRELQRQVEQGIQLSSPDMTLQTFLEQWLNGSAKDSVKPRTYEGYEAIIRVRVLPRIGRLKLAQVTPPVVQQLYLDLATDGLSPQSIINTHRCLHRALQQAVRWGLIVRNPTEAVNPPRAHRSELRVFTKAEAERFIDVVTEHPLSAMFVLAITTGMRLGELLGLKWNDIDLDARVLRVQRSLQRQRNNGLVFETPKTSRSRRRIVLSNHATNALRKHRGRQREHMIEVGDAWEDNDLVFPNAIGRPYDPSFVTPLFHRILNEHGLPRIRFHDLRHTAATLLLLKGQHPKTVSEMLGHATIAITLDTYSHYVPVLHERAAEAMDEIFGP